ncbi:MAG TPA: SMC-Scp complex subunit ScpB [Anaerolineaceae bacterium]|jgi:segregation and condensation protein B|nr:SMC-Scp complex subunit ScpB [Anaerolineaceae bacterium]HQC63568.1 SMC-Scp complex subunit ScpB [Anaerolineaceae bacterium]
MTDSEKLKLLEALLFSSPGLASVDALAQAMDISKKECAQLLETLKTQLKENHGIRLQMVKNQYQLVTAAEFAPAIESFLGLEVTTRLSQAALEALAIIAYKQPTTRPEIDSIRGVNSDGVVRTLLSRGLIEELGRSEAAGRPILYGVTPEFLQHFGLESLEQLPELNLDELLQGKAESEEVAEILKD